MTAIDVVAILITACIAIPIVGLLGGYAVWLSPVAVLFAAFLATVIELVRRR